MTGRTRRRRGRRAGLLGVLVTVAAVGAVLASRGPLGDVGAAFLLGVITGAAVVLAVVRPRLSLELRVSTRGTRARQVRGGRRW